MSYETAKARLDAATPGPWSTDPSYWNGMVWAPADDDGRMIEFALMKSRRRPIQDADLIAHAPTDLAAALEVVKAAKRAYAEADEHENDPDMDSYWCAMGDALDDFEALP